MDVVSSSSCERLGETGITARVQGFGAPQGRGVCGQRDDRESTALASQRACGLKAVHVRHAQIHQDDIEGSRDHLGHGFAAVVCRFHAGARLFQ